MIAAANYGNGQAFTQTLNARLLPARLQTQQFVGGRQGYLKALDQTFTYDNRGKVTAVTDLADMNNSRSYGYDPLGQLVSSSGPWGNGAYVYDSLANLRSKTEGGRTVTLSYDANNRLTQSVDSGATGTRGFTYDNRGNVVAMGAQNFTYDVSNQPVAISGAVSGSFVYDGNKRRVKQVIAPGSGSGAGAKTIKSRYSRSCIS